MADLYTPLSKDFIFPTNKAIGSTAKEADSPAIYLCGHSLGLQSHRARKLLEEEMDVWGAQAVEGHFVHASDRNWTSYTDLLTPYFAELVGAKEKEVACMGTLTANLHLMLDSFYKPTQNKYKILCEARAFPSDQYAFASRVEAHGYDASDAVIEISPREGEHTLRTEDILNVIQERAGEIALVLLSGVQYYTGQLFDISLITAKAKELGLTCGWDLAHAVGNVPLSLHDWNVDFAVWCTYKYLNGGPGSIAGLFIHENSNESGKPRSAGWWGNDLKTRFAMRKEFDPSPGAQGFQQSNPSIMSAAPLLGSLQLFKEVGMIKAVRERSLALTGKLEELLKKSEFYIPVEEATGDEKKGFTIITPSNPEERGAQLSLLFLPVGEGRMDKVFDVLRSKGVLGDERKPDVIRLTPVAMYNTMRDVEGAAKALDVALKEVDI